MRYLESVDNALRLLTLVAAKAKLGVSEAAVELGVAPSTAYRLLSTLRYRGFVIQGRDRTYRAGPALEEMVSSRMSRTNLAEIALPSLEALRDETDETSHLMVLVGRQVRIIASVESAQMLRVGSRVGAMLPAHFTSGGRLLLAELDADELDQLYPREGLPSLGLTASAMTALRRDLARCRKQGYAVNNGQTERGVCAIGVLVRDGDGASAALSVSIPSVRYRTDSVPGVITALTRAADAVAAELRT
ncbi:MAG: IclR family transcriptional regulator [Dermatophilaceae bacterium]